MKIQIFYAFDLCSNMTEPTTYQLLLTTYRHGHPNQGSHSITILFENPQFLRNHYKTWSNCGTHELLISNRVSMSV